MNTSAKPESFVGALLPVDELPAQNLLDQLAGHPDKPLIFSYEGHDVRPSYHVTEVKTGAFRALDCGANTESWNETFIQLWDIEEETREHMKAGKFLAIIAPIFQFWDFQNQSLRGRSRPRGPALPTKTPLPKLRKGRSRSRARSGALAITASRAATAPTASWWLDCSKARCQT
jgi:hypothetical protein